MQTSVSLQDPFSYSIYPMIVFIIIIIILTYYIIVKTKRERKKYIDITELHNIDIKNIKKIQQKYIEKLDIIEYRLEHKKMSIREAYQSLSNVIRFFVYEVTGIKVQNYTLEDIEKTNMPKLIELIKEYYVPEFSEDDIGNIKVSIVKTKEVIKKWN